MCCLYHHVECTVWVLFCINKCCGLFTPTSLQEQQEMCFDLRKPTTQFNIFFHRNLELVLQFIAYLLET